MALIDVSIDSKSVKHTLGELQELSENLQEKGIRTALRASARPLVETMKTLAPGRSMLRDSINAKQVKSGDGVRTGAGDRTLSFGENEYGVIVGPNVGTKSTVTTVNTSVGDVGVKLTRRFKMAKSVALWLEEGTKSHKISPDRYRGLYIGGRWVNRPVIHPGIRARRWISTAGESAASSVENTFYTSLDKQIDKYGR